MAKKFYKKVPKDDFLLINFLGNYGQSFKICKMHHFINSVY